MKVEIELVGPLDETQIPTMDGSRYPVWSSAWTPRSEMERHELRMRAVLARKVRRDLEKDMIR